MPIINTPKIIGRSLVIIFAVTSLYLYLNPCTVTETITQTEAVPTSGELLSQKVDHINYNIIALERIKENASKQQESLRKERDAELKQLTNQGEQKDRHLNPNLYIDAKCTTTSFDSCSYINKTLTLEARKEIHDNKQATVNTDTTGETVIVNEPTIQDITTSGINIIEE